MGDIIPIEILIKHLVTNYCKLMETLPIDYVEIGYRSIPLKGYLGEYFYCPEYILKDLMPSKKLVIILNEKDISVEHLQDVLLPCKQRQLNHYLTVGMSVVY